MDVLPLLGAPLVVTAADGERAGGASSRSIDVSAIFVDGLWESLREGREVVLLRGIERGGGGGLERSWWELKGCLMLDAMRRSRFGRQSVGGMKDLASFGQKYPKSEN